MLAMLAGLSVFSPAIRGQSAPHDYPTHARVEYVYECIARNGGKLSEMYKCSCVIDRIAVSLTYDEFVEAATYARYSTLGGERSGVFRDSDRARELGGRYRKLEAESFRVCNLPPPT